MHSRWKLARWASVGLMVLLVGCADPYKQTIEPVGSHDHDAFVGAMKKLPTDEKNLVNRYVARQQEEGVQPVGITVREAIDEQRRHEAEMASLPGKIIDGAVKVARALGPKAPVVVTPAVTTVVVPAPVAPATAATATATTTATTTPPVAPGTTAVAAAPATGLEMSGLLQEVDAITFPQDRVALIKRRASSMYFTTRQAITLAQTVSFPRMQVDLLTALYPRVVDRESFDDVYRILAFPEDRDALKARIDALNGR